MSDTNLRYQLFQKQLNAPNMISLQVFCIMCIENSYTVCLVFCLLSQQKKFTDHMIWK